MERMKECGNVVFIFSECYEMRCRIVIMILTSVAVPALLSKWS